MNRTGRVLMDLGRAAEGSGYGGEHKGDAVLLDSEGRHEYIKDRHDILWEAQYRVKGECASNNNKHEYGPGALYQPYVEGKHGRKGLGVEATGIRQGCFEMYSGTHR